MRADAEAQRIADRPADGMAQADWVGERVQVAQEQASTLSQQQQEHLALQSQLLADLR